MSAKDLSILIPARNEMFLAKTIEDILEHIEADTEVIAVLDGEWADPPIPQHERVNVIKLTESIGQREATDMACKLSKAKYVMKVDAHCSFDKGFDRKMLDAFKKCGGDVTMVPVMRNLWAFDWKCYHCGWKKYQGPRPKECQECGKSDKIRMKMMWVGKTNPQSTSYCFDPSPKFQYFEDWKHREKYKKDKQEKGLTETMSLQGSCFMLTRDKYWELKISDKAFGSWGSQGIEVACKTWLSGGRVLVNHNTWYAHLFRTQGEGFSFPYPMSGKQQSFAQKYAYDQFFNGNWEGIKRPLSWLVEKFWPVKGWTEEDLARLKKSEKNKSEIPAQTKNGGEQVDITERASTEVKPSETSIVESNQSIATVSASKDRHTASGDLITTPKEDNTVQISEGEYVVSVNLSENKNNEGTKVSGVCYAVEPSNKIIHFSDNKIVLKIRIEKNTDWGK